MKKSLGVILFISLFGVASFWLVGLRVFAISLDNDQGMQISPTKVELNGLKGNTYEVKLKVTNITTSVLSYTSTVDDFGAADETGAPKVLLGSNMPTTASIKTWLDEIDEFTLDPYEVQEISVLITIPSNAEPGGHYGVLRFSGQAPEVKSSSVGLAVSAGVLFLIRVEGDITEDSKLASLYSANGDKQNWFFENSPINFVTRIRNDGNVHTKPTGSIEVRDMFGGLVDSVPVNNDEQNVLPNSIRRFDGTLDHPWMIGRYTADLALAYGSHGQVITGTIRFWVIPYKIILTILAVIGLIVYITHRIIKVYNRRMVERVRREVEAAIENKKMEYSNEISKKDTKETTTKNNKSDESH